MLKGKRVLFIGQSGVGKSTIINRIIPDVQQKTADISRKYNRGKHTTVYSVLFQHGDFHIIDTPGIREIEVWGVEQNEIASYFRDFRPFLGTCRFPSCLHISEPDCAVKEAVEAGAINRDRYESYLRIVQSRDGSPHTGPVTV